MFDDRQYDQFTDDDKKTIVSAQSQSQRFEGGAQEEEQRAEGWKTLVTKIKAMRMKTEVQTQRKARAQSQNRKRTATLLDESGTGQIRKSDDTARTRRARKDEL